MIRPLEPRVGENRPINVIKREAEAFLREMLAEGIFPSSEAFEQRVKEVIAEIEENKVECMLWEETNEDGIMERRKLQGVSSNGYLQTKEELEWGVRFAWRNSRKCIMRAHAWDLKCVDLRDIKTSKGMVDAIINHAPAAYNKGRIVPTGEFLA
jgi:nitric oxide synthase oxygenase domain/subunit